MIVIDKNVPLPPEKKGEPKYPWKYMEIGDSFFAPNVKPLNLQRGAYSAGKKHGHKYKVAAEGTGARVWRIA